VSEVFVDAAAWIALLNSRDDLHVRAVEQRKELYRNKSRLVTTEFVLLEVADALSSPLFRARVVAFLRGLQREQNVQTIPASPVLIEAGLALFGQRPDKEWSLTDCISFAVMTERALFDAFTSDHHFEQAGFHKLL
jgi:predicted nucleic acid-binding protein